VVLDGVEGGGALGAIGTALEHAPAPHVIVLAADLPFVSARFLAHLAGLRDEADAVVPKDRAGWHPLCACYGRHMAGAIRARVQRGDLRVADALDDWRIRAVEAGELEPGCDGTAHQRICAE
jgi:molybdopterin-guanine dinucleotide biosynthesis protein A